MKPTRTLRLPLLGLLVFLAGCVGLGNNPAATFQKTGDHYVVEVSGTRAGWSHDLSKLESYKASRKFDIPRIDGTIDGREIGRSPELYPYVGTITIKGTKMVVELSYDNHEFHRLDRVDWNGSYTLVEKPGGGPKAEPKKEK